MSGEAPRPPSGGGDRPPHVFQAPKPRASLLGLDRLAREKKMERERSEGGAAVKRARPVTSMSFAEDGPDGDAGDGREDGRGDGADRSDRSDRAGGGFARAPKRPRQNFRGYRVETPSHPGGIDEDVRRDIDDRRRDRGDRGDRGLAARSDSHRREYHREEARRGSHTRERGAGAAGASGRDTAGMEAILARARGGDRWRDRTDTPGHRAPARETGDASVRRDEWEETPARAAPNASPWTDRTERDGGGGDGGGSFRGSRPGSARGGSRGSNSSVVAATPRGTPSWRSNAWMRGSSGAET